MWKPDPATIITAEQKALAKRATAFPVLERAGLWLMLGRIGIAKADVLDRINAMEDAGAASDLRIEIEERGQFQRMDFVMVELARLLEIPEGQFDDLWSFAATF